MISFGPQVRVFVATQPIDFRIGVHGLVALVAQGFQANPYSGDVFVFRSKRADRLKCLAFDGTGIVLATKWLEEGKFVWPPVQSGTLLLTATQLAMLFDGLGDWFRVAPQPTKRPTKVA
jgi:transposase